MTHYRKPPPATPDGQPITDYDLALVRRTFDRAVWPVPQLIAEIDRLRATNDRLIHALRVAAHDQAGEPDPDSGFPVCSVCGAIQT